MGEMEYSQRRDYLSIKEAATHYEVSRAKLHRMISMGRLASIKDTRDERATLLRVEDLEQIFRLPSEKPVDAHRRREAYAAPAPGLLTAQRRARIDALRHRIANSGQRVDDSVDLVRQQREQRTVELGHATPELDADVGE